MGRPRQAARAALPRPVLRRRRHPALPRSPQGRPVLVQAGQSAAGISLAARYAELVFSGPPSLEAAVAFRAELHAAGRGRGRDPGQVLVLPALMITLGGTEAEARARARRAGRAGEPRIPVAERALHGRARPRRLRPGRTAARRALRRPSRRRAAPSSCMRPPASTPDAAAARGRPRLAEAGPDAVHRHPRTARRPHHRLAGRRRGRRLHDHGIDTAARAGGVCRPRRAHPAGPRPLSDRVLRAHAARSPRTSAAGGARRRAASLNPQKPGQAACQSPSARNSMFSAPSLCRPKSSSGASSFWPLGS